MKWLLPPVLLSAGLAVAAIGVPDSAHADTTWRLATKMPPESPEGRTHTRFAELVEEYTDGRLIIEIFPAEQLGSSEAALEQLQLGVIHAYVDGPQYAQRWVPEIRFTAASFLFDDRDHWVRFMESELVRSWYDRAEEEAGIAVLGNPAEIFRGPYRVMVSTVAVESLDDVANIEIRLPPDEMQTTTWSHLGADVRTMAWTDVYEGMQRGIVNAVNSPIALVESMNFHEVGDYIVRHDDFYQSLTYFMNADQWNALDPELQDAVLRAHAELGDYSEQLNMEAADESVETMKEGGIEFIDIDRAPFIRKMREWYDEQEATGGLPEGFLETVEQTRGAS